MGGKSSKCKICHKSKDLTQLECGHMYHQDCINKVYNEYRCCITNHNFDNLEITFRGKCSSGTVVTNLSS